SAAASATEICPVSIRTHKSYFCSAVKNRFGLRAVVVIDDGLLRKGQQPCQMRSERNRDLSREVRCNTEGATLGPRRSRESPARRGTRRPPGVVDQQSSQGGRVSDRQNLRRLGRNDLIDPRPHA